MTNPAPQGDAEQPATSTETTTEKPESTSEYEGAAPRDGNDRDDTEVKTETSSSSGQ